MFLANGFDDYLSKPVDGKTLEQMVQKYLPENKIQPVTKDEFDFGTEEFYHHQSDYYEPHGNSQESQAAPPPQAGNPPAPQEPPQTAVPAPAAETVAAPTADAATAGTTTGATEAGAVAGTTAAAEATAAAENTTAEATATAAATAAAATPEAFASEPAEAAAPEDEQIDLPTAMKYCGGMEAMQIKFLTLYVSRYQMVRDQLQKDFDEENIPDYTTHVHALKSTSLSIGGVKLSEAAKALEMAGHAIQDGPEEEKQAFIDYIKENHGPTMEMYAKLIEEAKTRFGIVPE
jgi:HPt (histidine-containing phosphotransfer) domain-containing protein